jgi:hypothetical protein
MGIVCG